MFEYHTKDQWKKKLDAYQLTWEKLKNAIERHDAVSTKIYTDQIDQFNLELKPLFIKMGIMV